MLILELDPCTSNPCQNGGKCISDIHTFKCICPARYSGDYCEGSNY